MRRSKQIKQKMNMFYVNLMLPPIKLTNYTVYNLSYLTEILIYDKVKVYKKFYLKEIEYERRTR